MMDVDFQNIEKLFSRLMDFLGGIFNQLEIQEVQDFIDVGEYGLALETLVDIVDEENKNISKEILNSIRELAVAMSMDQSVFDDRLRKHLM